jgi:hypothetical protein
LREKQKRGPHLEPAYGGDIEQVARDTDEQVAARVAEWERAQGMEPRDWVAWGRREEGKGEG